MKAIVLLIPILAACDLSSLQSGSCTPGRETCRGTCVGPVGGIRTCLANGDGGAVDGGSEQDLAGVQDGSPVDQTGTPGDMANPLDPARPPTAVTGCKPGLLGYALTAKAVACQESGSGQSIVNHCDAALGWSLCAAPPLSAAVCDTIPWGFFAGSAHGREAKIPPDASMICFWAGLNENADQKYVFGCGPSMGTQTTTHPSSLVPCGGYDRAVVCKTKTLKPMTSWTCDSGSPPSDNDLNLVFPGSPKDGALCCHA